MTNTRDLVILERDVADRRQTESGGGNVPDVTTEPPIPFDAECPWCHKDSDAGERFDGEDFWCGTCGRHVQAVCFVDKDDNHSFAVIKVGHYRVLADPRTCRQRNQARKRRRGWR